ncbi:hypothetical protein SUDANB120_06027 [Streptomyces sp. enrichment culture]|uniref:hypothetical protein n=1 Tax=Streptomyces TaxID=1883 RepID=UPI00167C0E5F|nr:MULTISPECIES: hypothetical protein [Streptomyces]MBD3577595.1 hypothetical protein [Streptomyces sp. KD18]GGT09678.1 hypothetical protein GCM10010286_38960 [Streptomyces toxytricini]
MKSVLRTASAIILALGTAVFGSGSAVAAAFSEDVPVIIQCNNPTSVSLVDASGGDSLVSQLIAVLAEDDGVGANDGNNASAVDTGSGGTASGGDASQSANNNRCGLSSDVDASTRIDNSQRIDNSRRLTFDNGPGLL